MEHMPPPAEELALLDRELAELDARRARLLTRRAWLVAALRPPAPPAPGWNPAAWGTSSAGRPVDPVQPWGFAPSPSASTPRSAQNVLLALGGLLLTVAAIGFTLSWGSMGTGGRAAVLGTVTLGALAAPAVLLPRRLRATAEALAALALPLTLLNVYVLHGVVAPDSGRLAYTAASAAVLTALWSAYGLALRPLRMPLPAAVALAQWPLLLWAWAAGASALMVGWALLATAVLDGTVALYGKGLAVRITACAGGAAAGSGALLVGLAGSMTASGPLDALAPGALLLTASAAALAGAWRAPDGFAQTGGVVAGLLAVAAVGRVPDAAAHDGWGVLAYLLCGLALTTAVRVRLPRNVGRGLLAASGAVVAGALVWAAPPVAAVLLGPVSLLSELWAGTPESFRAALGASVPWSRVAAAPVVLALVAGALAAVHRWWPAVVRVAAPLLAPAAGGTAGTSAAGAARGVWGPGGGPRAGAARRPSEAALRGAAGAAALGLGWGALVLAAAVLDAPYAVAVAGETVLVAGLLACALRGGRAGREGSPAVRVTALVGSVAGSVSVGLLSLPSGAASCAVSGALAALFAGAAVRERPGRTQAAFGAAAVVWGTVLTACAGRLLGLAPYGTAPLMLVVPALTVALGARLRRHPAALPVELAGALGAVVAVAFAASDAPFLALSLGLSGVLAAGAAVRPERRPVAGYAAGALFVLAAWVRLAASEVSAPEAYTLPVTVCALAVGALRRREDPEASSWTAYGPGLAATLLPSLAAAWTEPHGQRPLLLGVAALVVTLLGARHRLQAPLLIGGTVLALDALHELAPYVVQVAGALPRWLAPALAGLLLLGVGATYEQRLRDARRLRKTLGRMR
ncbi:SCO7613 C-terminal domain-containing membrane protein [Streptomyces pratensis]|uniref:SCO7613 C-terminal domain-containing membrane protein n=1 Tax=Streptomyces pratensis TaxID=1169025 RepID=UPI0030170D81